MLDSVTLLTFAQELLSAALPILKGNYQHLIEQARTGDIAQSGVVQWKATQKKEIVTKGEQDAEKVMREMVRTSFPTHDIAGEEWGYCISGSPYLWVFDPIDGTAAMLDAAIQTAHNMETDAHQAPFFGITIGLLFENKPILGLVCDILHNRTWWGGIDIPTCCNHAPILLPPAPPLPDAAISCTAPNIMFSSEQRHIFDDFTSQVGHIVTHRNCIGFMQLLEGLTHIVWEGDLAFHDVAALLPILKNAGIRVSDEYGHPFVFSTETYHQEYRIIAAHPALYEDVLTYSRTITARNDTKDTEEGFYNRKF